MWINQPLAFMCCCNMFTQTLQAHRGKCIQQQREHRQQGDSKFRCRWRWEIRSMEGDQQNDRQIRLKWSDTHTHMLAEFQRKTSQHLNTCQGAWCNHWTTYLNVCHCSCMPSEFRHRMESIGWHLSWLKAANILLYEFSVRLSRPMQSSLHCLLWSMDHEWHLMVLQTVFSFFKKRMNIVARFQVHAGTLHLDLDATQYSLAIVLRGPEFDFVFLEHGSLIMTANFMDR